MITITIDNATNLQAARKIIDLLIDLKKIPSQVAPPYVQLQLDLAETAEENVAHEDYLAEEKLGTVEDREIEQEEKLDRRGLPWDARIHSTHKTKNKDGTWRQVRTVDKKILDAVEKELYEARGLTPPANDIPLPPVKMTNLESLPITVPLTEETIETAPTFEDAQKIILAHVRSGKLNYKNLEKGLRLLGLENVLALKSRVDLIPDALQIIEGIVADENK